MGLGTFQPFLSSPRNLTRLDLCGIPGSLARPDELHLKLAEFSGYRPPASGGKSPAHLLKRFFGWKVSWN